jgi:hypothetical protein
LVTARKDSLMTNWKKVGKAWATGGASIAYDKAKQRNADPDAPAENAAAAPETPAATEATIPSGSGNGLNQSGDAQPHAEALALDLDSDDDDDDGPDDFKFLTKDTGVAGEVGRLKKRVKKSLETNLATEEVIQIVIRGARGQAIVATGSRAFVLKPGFMAGASFGAEVTSWSYRSLAGIQVHKGMVSGAVVLQAPGQAGVNTSYWGNSKDDPFKAPNAIPVAKEWDLVQRGAAELRNLIDAAHAPAHQAPASVPAASMASELAQLAELRGAGHLSEEEFAAAKQQILERAKAA